MTETAPDPAITVAGEGAVSHARRVNAVAHVVGVESDMADDARNFGECRGCGHGAVCHLRGRFATLDQSLFRGVSGMPESSPCRVRADTRDNEP